MSGAGFPISRRVLLAGILLAGTKAAPASARRLTFPARDGVPVTARLYGDGPHGLVLVPGGHGVGATWHSQAERLAEAGFRVLAMDYRGRGDSTADPDDEKTHLDVLGAVQQLRSTGAERVSVVGASWGGWAAATAAIAAPGLVDRLVLLAPSPVEHPERMGGRKLFIVARDDRDGAGRARLETIRDQHDRAPPPRQLVVLDGSAHAQFLFLTPEGERLYSEILEFLTRA